MARISPLPSKPASSIKKQPVANPLAINEISDQTFERFRAFLFEVSGISLGPERQTMVAARLSKRLRHYGLSSFDAYYDLIVSEAHPDERQAALDLLTTNETYFFREPRHFDFLRDQILSGHPRGRSLRVWSAASSSGEEAYSIAMLLADKLGEHPWEVVGSDISTRVLETARNGHYRMNRIDGIPRAYLEKFCLKGKGDQEGTLLIDRPIRERVHFHKVNLMHPLPDVGLFDVIFLRNVLIYFDQDTKRNVVSRLLSVLKPGGHFLIGHSESLKGIVDSLELVAATTYRKPLEVRR